MTSKPIKIAATVVVALAAGAGIYTYTRPAATATPGAPASGSPADTVVLMLHIDFVLEKHQIHGYVAFILDLSALHDMQEQIDLYIARAMGQA